MYMYVCTSNFSIISDNLKGHETPLFQQGVFTPLLWKKSKKWACPALFRGECRRKKRGMVWECLFGRADFQSQNTHTHTHTHTHTYTHTHTHTHWGQSDCVYMDICSQIICQIIKWLTLTAVWLFHSRNSFMSLATNE